MKQTAKTLERLPRNGGEPRGGKRIRRLLPETDRPLSARAGGIQPAARRDLAALERTGPGGTGARRKEENVNTEGNENEYQTKPEWQGRYDRVGGRCQKR